MARRAVGQAIVALLLFVVASWAFLDLNWTLAFQAKHVGEDPERTVYLGSRAMSAWDFYLYELLPKVPLRWPRSVLATQDRNTLWLVRYTVLGIIGWCASIWLRAVLNQTPPANVPFLCSLFLSGVGGVISYYLLKLMPLSSFVAQHALLDSWSVLPLLGGLFAIPFYRALEAFVPALLGRLKKLLG